MYPCSVHTYYMKIFSDIYIYIYISEDLAICETCASYSLIDHDHILLHIPMYRYICIYTSRMQAGPNLGASHQSQGNLKASEWSTWKVNGKPYPTIIPKQQLYNIVFFIQFHQLLYFSLRIAILFAPQLFSFTSAQIANYGLILACINTHTIIK